MNKTSKAATRVVGRSAYFAGALILATASISVQANENKPGHLTGLDMHQSDEELIVGGEPVRLLGISFPYEAGVCGQNHNQCRSNAMDLLADWIARPEQVECEVLMTLSSGLNMSRCVYQDQELGAWLVGSGLAVADRRATRRYIREENDARRAGLGIWGDQAVRQIRLSSNDRPQVSATK